MPYKKYYSLSSMVRTINSRCPHHFATYSLRRVNISYQRHRIMSSQGTNDKPFWTMICKITYLNVFSSSTHTSFTQNKYFNYSILNIDLLGTKKISYQLFFFDKSHKIQPLRWSRVLSFSLTKEPLSMALND